MNQQRKLNNSRSRSRSPDRIKQTSKVHPPQNKIQKQRESKSDSESESDNDSNSNRSDSSNSSQNSQTSNSQCQNSDSYSDSDDSYSQNSQSSSIPSYYAEIIGKNQRYSKKEMQEIYGQQKKSKQSKNRERIQNFYKQKDNNALKLKMSRNRYKKIIFNTLLDKNKKQQWKEQIPNIEDLIIQNVIYYKDLSQYKQDFRQIVEKTVIKEVSHNVWNQWVLRVLNLQKCGSVLHCIPQMDAVINDRKETIEHMNRKLKKQDCQDPDKTYDEIIQYAKIICDKYLSFKNDLLQNQELMAIWSQQTLIENYYNVNKNDKENDKLIDEICESNYQINIIEENYNHISQFFDKFAPENNFRLKNFLILELVFNYEFIGGIGYQWAIPPTLMKHLVEKLDVQQEIFASPINHYFDTFRSMFEIDKNFGGQGSSLDYNLEFKEGGYEANPPFVEVLMVKSSEIIVKNLKRMQEKNQKFLVFYILPWKQSQAYKNLSENKEFVIDELEFQRNEHCYFDITKRIHQLSPFNTYIIIVGTQYYKNKYDISMKDDIISYYKQQSKFVPPLEDNI